VTSWDELTMPPTPLGRLIHRRMRELGLRPVRVAALLGYKNLGKGCRRLDQISQGDVARLDLLLAKLPAVLDLPPDEVMAAVKETRQQIESAKREREEAERRRYFRPHAYIVTEPDVQGRMIHRFRWIDFGSWLSIEDIHRRVQAEILHRQRKQYLVAKPVGYEIFWTPDRLERFDLDGNLLEVREPYYKAATAASR
jgi:hypothetical protein